MEVIHSGYHHLPPVARDQLVKFERVRHPHQFHHGDGVIGPERGLMFSVDLKDSHFRSPSIRSRIRISILLSREGCTNAGHCVLAFPQLLRSLPGVLLWFQSGLIGGGSDSVTLDD